MMGCHVKPIDKHQTKIGEKSKKFKICLKCDVIVNIYFMEEQRMYLCQQRLNGKKARYPLNTYGFPFKNSGSS